MTTPERRAINLSLTNNWSIKIDNALLNCAVFSDFKKGFDTSDREIILQKPTNYGVDQNTIRFLLPI